MEDDKIMKSIGLGLLGAAVVAGVALITYKVYNCMGEEEEVIFSIEGIDEEE